MKTTKQKMQTLFDNVGVKPVGRGSHKGYEFFVGDGLVKAPFPKFKKFGVEDWHFPEGCFVGLWFLAKDEEAVSFGRPLFFNRYDKDLIAYEPSSQQQARMRATTNDAVEHIETLVANEKEGPSLHV